MDNIICHEVVDINSKGITLKYRNSNVFIEFEECARNYAKQNFLNSSKCVAVRDITALTFIFYTCPKTKMVFKKNFLTSLFTGKSAVSKFMDLQNSINRFGFTSFDLS